MTARGLSRFNPAAHYTSHLGIMEKLTEVLSSPSHDAFEMGGYAMYVWPSFIIAALVMSAMVIASMHSLRKAQKTLAELQQTATFSSHNEA